MKNKRKISIAVIIGICLIILIGLFYKIYVHYYYHERKTEIYKLESAYRLENENLDINKVKCQEGTGEFYFLEGLKAYDLGNFYIAEENFEKALSVSYSDRALPTYVYYYLNQCTYLQRGSGDIELVSLAMEEALKYVPLANDTEMLWELISSISLSAETDKKAIELMTEYAQNQEHIKLATWAWLKNCIGMLEFNNEEYAKAIRHFYDVEVMLEDSKMTSLLRKELYYAKEYIANIYYIFEDFEKSALLYQELVESNLKNKDFHGYICCLNMANAYLEISDTQNAGKAVQILEENMEKVESSLVAEVNASMNDVMANICMMEGNYDQADEYLNKAEEFYNNRSANAVLGGKAYIVLSRYRHMIHEGKLKEAQNGLEEFVISEEAVYYGLDNECYRLLEEIYLQTNQKDKLITTYQKLLELDDDFITATQQEYLEFSKFYSENNRLKESNEKLYRSNFVAIIGIIFISIILILVLILVRLLSQKNVTDQLTGLYNRKKLNALLRKYERNGTPSDFGVVMIDIDYFKRYNDTYGHQAGDVVLKEVAGVLKEAVRKKDTVIRYGGEEFLILLNGIKKKNAEEICQKIHNKLREKALPHSASEVSEYVTMSMGLVHQKEKKGLTLEKLIGNADECLYQSKEAGRNRVTVKED